MKLLKGSIGRLEFIAGYLLFIFVAGVVAVIIRSSPDALWFLGWLFGLFIAFPVVFTLLVKRLHDVEKSGAWSLLIFIPGINLLMVLLLCVWPVKLPR